MKIILKVVIALGMILFSLVIWSYDSVSYKNQLEAKKGILDASHWNFSKDGAISLNGEWELYDNSLLTPEDFKVEGKKPSPTDYIRLTSTRFHRNDNKKIDPLGVKTYRLVVNLSPTNEVYGLKVENIKMSNRVFVNNMITGESGNPAEKDKGYIPNMIPYDVYFDVIENKVEIIMQVANFDYPFGENLYKIQFGERKDITSMTTANFSIELASIMSLFFFGVYYLTMYSIRKIDKSYFYWGLSLLLMFGALFLNGQKILTQLIPGIQLEVLNKGNMTINMLFIMSLASLVSEVNKEILSKRLLKRFKIFGVVYIIVGLLLNIYLNVLLSIVVLSFIVLFFLYLIIKLVIVILKNRKKYAEQKENVLFLNCIVGIFICLVNNYIFEFSLVYSKVIGSIALGVSMVFMAIILSHKFFLAYKNIESMAEELIKINRIKDEFITKTTYELKTPLYGIINIAETIIHKSSPLDSNISDIVMIKSMALRLSSIINNTLDFTLIRNNQLKVNISIVDIMVCINLVIEGFDHIVKSKNIVIINNIKSSIMVKGDKNKIGQVVFNLINNSIKYMDKGTIEINHYKLNKEVYILIEDTGNGIPKSKHGKIFMPYESESAKGIGLGLYISKSLVTLMNGKLHLDWSKVNGGSRFVLSLPLVEKKNRFFKRSGYEINSYRAASLSDLKTDNTKEFKGNILIVENEVENVLTAVNILGREGYKVIVAMSKDEVMDKIRENTIDLIILDLIMPRVSGIDMCRIIREKYSVIEMPILISSFKNTNYDLDLALKAGANDIIVKPFEENEIAARVKTLINLKRAMEDAVKSELAFLQAQIKPHFLYNTLSAIISFCYTDGEKAAKLLTCFSKYLRFTFDMDSKSMYTSLRSELEAVDAYVEIIRARLGEKINIEYDIDPHIIDEKIPSFYIQPLVENAIKHGLYEKEEGGTVYVSVKRSNGKLYISVRDNGLGITKEKLEELNNMDSNDSRVGLSNVRKRAKRLNEADINIYSTKGEGTTVNITFRYL